MFELSVKAGDRKGKSLRNAVRYFLAGREIMKLDWLKDSERFWGRFWLLVSALGAVHKLRKHKLGPFCTPQGVSPMLSLWAFENFRPHPPLKCLRNLWTAPWEEKFSDATICSFRGYVTNYVHRM